MIPLDLIARQFSQGQPIRCLQPLGNGLINDTYLVETAANPFVLQRLNRSVFVEPEKVIANLAQLNRHSADSVSLRVPKMLPANHGEYFYETADGDFWRALELISPGVSRERISNLTEAAQVGWALAQFHRLCASLPSDTLFDTLPGFHIAPSYHAIYQERLSQPVNVPVDAEFKDCVDFIESMRSLIPQLEQAKRNGSLRERVIHGDPKLNNFLFLPDSDHIVALVDLDTVKPGLIHYDIGDCLRSCCHNSADDSFNLELCRVILADYLREAVAFFSAADYDFLYTAIALIPLELGLRFFSDYLVGNVYFKAAHPRHNLERALAQFRLCASIDRQQAEIEKVIAQLPT